jgi:two-component sensor histidine kinase
MAKNVSTCTLAGLSGVSADQTTVQMDELRREVQDLRAQLTERKVVASRYAMMLREGDHRIKNSLQLVASMMQLQARREPAGSARAALQAAAGRVSSVAGIHDALQETPGFDLVNLGATLRKICDGLQAMAGDQGFIQVIVTAEDIEVPVALAQPITLAVNELVVNALRHAFPTHEHGSVQVNLRRTETGLTISVTDDGVGLPPDYAAGQGYGRALVGTMMKQIGGELVTENNGGARFTMHAPLPRLRS